MLRQRPLALLLSFVLAFSCIPSVAFADPDKGVDELESSQPEEVASGIPDSTEALPENDSGDESLENDELSQLNVLPPETNQIETEAEGEDKGEDEITTLAENKSDLTPGTYIFRSALSLTAVLDVEKGSLAAAANVRIWNSNMTNAQRFLVRLDSEGYAIIENVNSGMVLDVSGARTSNRTNVCQYTENGTDAQKWIIKSSGDAYIFESALKEGLVLDVADGNGSSGTNLQVYRENGTSAQKFYAHVSNLDFAPVDAGISEGVYTIKTSLDTSKLIDIAGGKNADKTGAQIYHANGTLAQKFHISRNSRGYYSIRAYHSGSALAVLNGNVFATTKVVQIAYNADDPSQEWSISQNGDGSYTIKARTSGLALDVQWASTNNRTPLHVYNSNASTAQKWIIAQDTAPLLNEGIFQIGSACSSSRVLDLAGGHYTTTGNIQLYSSNGTPAQRFKVIRNSDGSYCFRNLASGLYLKEVSGNVAHGTAASDGSHTWKAVLQFGGIQLINSASGKAMAVAGGVDANLSNIEVAAPQQSAAQRFLFSGARPITSSTYTIESAVSGYSLDVAGGLRAAGTNVQIWYSNDSGAQKWVVEEVGGGAYIIKNAKSGKALDVHNGRAEPGANIQQWHYNGGIAQIWYIEPSDDGWFYLRSAVGNYYLGSYYGNSLLQNKANDAVQKFRFHKTTYVPEDFTDCVSSFYTISTNTWNGTYNMMRALNSFNNVVIWPGQTLSFFGTAGRCGAAEGYLLAGVVGGSGYGGGICQASTTLYGAAIRANLTVVQRQNHSVPSTYVPIGQDAMVNWGTSDLKLRNDNNYPIKIVVNCYGNTLQCDMYGIQPEWYDYIAIDSWRTGSRSASAHKVYYKDGQIIHYEGLPSSWY